MTAPSALLKDILTDAGVGIVDGATGDWKVYLGKQVDNPARVITLYDTGGLAPEPKWLLNYPDVTIQVRGANYAEAYDKMSDVRSALVGIDPVTVTDVGRIDGIIQIGDLIFMGNDAKDRPQFSATFRLYYEPEADDFTNRETL